MTSTKAPVQALRSRWFAWGVHLGLWLLLGLTVLHLGGNPPGFSETVSYSTSLQNPVPVNRCGSLFTAHLWPQPIAESEATDPFFTRYFVPPPSPAPPPPPTTRKIEVTYQGFYQTGDGPKQAIVKVAEAFVTARIGAPVATNLYVAEATMQQLTLTNAAAQKNLLPLNVKKELEVPIK